MNTTPLTNQSAAISAAAKFMKAYSERDRATANVELLSAVGAQEGEVYAFAYALVTIADTAMRESARVLDVEPRQVREAIEKMALAYFEEEAAHG